MERNDVRSRAEAEVRERARARGARDVDELNHELEVHTVELEIQNEELKKADRELRHSKQRFAHLFEHAPVAYLSLDIEGRVRTANRAACALLAAAPKELVGQRLSRFVATQDAVPLHRHLRAAARGQVAAPCHVDLAPHGTMIPVRLESVALEAEAGAREILTVLHDLSDVMRIEREATARRTRLAAVLDGAFDGIVEFDARGIIESANSAARQLLDLGEDDIAGRPLDAYLSHVTATELVSLVSAQGGRVGPLRVMLTPPGSDAPIPTEVGLVEVASERDDPRWGERQFLAILRDLREREHKEVQLRQADKLEALVAAASGVAHDLVNLLMGVGGVVDTALRAGVSDDAEEALEQLDDAVDRGAVLAKRLLDFARSTPRAEQTLHVDPFIQSGRSLLRGMLDEHIDLRLELGADDAAVVADKTELEQVLLNLIRNARDAMPRGGVVTVATRTVALSSDEARGRGLRPGPYVLLTVEDEGHGMDAETLAHAFEPFYSTKDEDRGTGVGLSSVREICRRLDGAVRCESTPGEGTTFYVYLPLAAAVGYPEPAGDQRMPSGHGRVLVIEDNELVRDTIAHFLHELGYQPVTTGDVDAAVREPDSWRDAVAVITDVILRDTLGHHAVAAVQAVAPDVPIVYISSYPAASLRERGLLGRDDVFLLKPFNAHALGATLQRAMHARLG